jgi:filamin
MPVVENNGVYTANFTPNEVGDWDISILYDGKHIQGSPFSVRVFDAAQVKVFGLEGGSVGHPFSFSVDTSSAGEGELDVSINSRGRPIPVQVYPEGRGLYKVTFTPDGPGIYTIRVYFGGSEVNGSPYTLEIVDSGVVTAVGTGLSSVEVNRRSTFEIRTGAKGGSGDIRVAITSPRGHQIPSDIHNNGDGSYVVEYTAGEVGEYIIDVYYYGKPIQGSPFRVHAYDGKKISVRNIPHSGTVGQPCNLTLMQSTPDLVTWRSWLMMVQYHAVYRIEAIDSSMQPLHQNLPLFTSYR